MQTTIRIQNDPTNLAETNQTQRSPDSRVSISLVLPAWNEADVIVRAIDEAAVALSCIAYTYEIIVVDDGSSDDTASLVQAASDRLPRVRLIQHQVNCGYGASLRSGFAAAKMDLVAFTDADCQYDLNELDRLVFLARDYDIVCGYRMDRKDTPLRRLYSKVYDQLVRLLIGTTVRDIDCALKMFRRQVVQKLKITTDGFLVNSELLTQARQHGYTVVEVGVSHRSRTEGESTVSIGHIPKVLNDLIRYWWNAVQFPSTTPESFFRNSSETLETNRQFRWYQLAFLLVAAVFVFSNLGYPLIDRDETRYAEIPREMLVTGNWILPQLNFEPYYDKPPMLYWLCALSYRAFGVSEWSARLVPALASLVTLWATMWFASRWFNRRVGLYSGMVLMLSAGFVFFSRYLLIDGVFSALVTLSLCTSLEALRGKDLRLRWWIASAIFCGLGILTKGPVAIVLSLPPVFAFAWLSDSHARAKLAHYAMYVGVASIVAVPWFVMVAMQDPHFLGEFFVKHNLNRFAGEFHNRPIWYFVPVLLVAGHPWSFLSVSMTRFLLDRSNSTSQQRPQVLGFLLLWSGWCFVFFSLSRCKLPTYLLPLAPALAMMIGYFLHCTFAQSTSKFSSQFDRFWSAKIATATTCLAGVGFIIFALAFRLDISTGTQLWALLWTALLIGTVLLIHDQRHRSTAWVSSGLVAGLLCLMVMHALVPAYSRSQTLLGQGSPLREDVVSAKIPIATVAHEFSEVPYYMNRSKINHWLDSQSPELDRFVLSHPESILILSRKQTVESLRQTLPDGVRATVVARRGPAQIVHIVTRDQPQIASRKSESRKN